MTDHRIPEGETLNAARELFGQRSVVDAMLAGVGDDGAAIPASRLFAYARGKLAADAAIERALNSDLRVRAAFKAMVAGLARYSLPRAVAASTGTFPARHTRDCVVRVAPSQAELEQVYLIVELKNDGADAPTTLVICKEDEMARTALQPAYNNVSQTILGRDSDVVRMLFDPDTEIFLT